MQPIRCRWISVALWALLAPACTAPEPSPDLLAPSQAQTQLRSFQTRVIETGDKRHVMRGVLAVLQDLGFLIERANEPLGVITAARFVEPDDGTAGSFVVPGHSYVVAVTAIVRSWGDDQTEVRINAVFNNRPVGDEEVYVNFFAALSRSLFLTEG